MAFVDDGYSPLSHVVTIKSGRLSPLKPVNSNEECPKSGCPLKDDLWSEDSLAVVAISMLRQVLAVVIEFS